METVNHFRCIDFIIDNADVALTEDMIKNLHKILKNNTTDGQKSWFAVGDYKQLPNEVGGIETSLPEDVHIHMEDLLDTYYQTDKKTLNDIIDFNVHFERIHPFQDGNGRVGRLIMFKECLANDIVPFIINDEVKMFYYRGLNEWGHINEYLTDTCLAAQDDYIRTLDYFRIKY